MQESLRQYKRVRLKAKQVILIFQQSRLKVRDRTASFSISAELSNMIDEFLSEHAYKTGPMVET
jgi:hypothetical protein